MEFSDNTGHIFSLPSYSEKPIGYEYEEYPYIFWIDPTNSTKLSINNFYSRPIYALYELKEDINIEDLRNDKDPIIDIEVYVENSNVFNLVSSKYIHDYILSDKYNNLNDYIDLNDINSNSSFIKSKLTNEDLFVMFTSEKLNNSTTINYLLIPIYPIANATESGIWITNIMIHINDKSIYKDEWCYISVGGEFVNEYEELIINGRNNGVKLPKDILKAVYSESLYNDEFNEAIYNEKLKEYLVNIMGIKGECGNFNSAIKSLKWFGYGDKLSIAKLLKTDNDLKAQYIYDYFNISNDVITSFKTFTTDSLISLLLMLNKESDELYKFEPDKSFFGENKPKMISLLDSYVKIKIGNHDMPIENDDEKYWYWKPYFDFSFMELGIKLMCLKIFYKKYFLPIHLSIHNASLGYRVFANDIKLTNQIGYSITQPSIIINERDKEVQFLGNGIHYFTKQIHIIDDNFNEYSVPNINNDNRLWFYMDDTCVNIPIKFITNENTNKGYFNCVLLLQFANDNRTLYESHFSFIQNNEMTYKNFIIFPKKFNVSIFDCDKINVKSNFFEYWINRKFIIKLLVNNRWYEYEFELRINKPTIDFGILRYRYYLNEHNYLINKIKSRTSINGIHSLIYADAQDIDKIKNIDLDAGDYSDINFINNQIYYRLGLSGDNSLTYINSINFNVKENESKYEDHELLKNVHWNSNLKDDDLLYQYFASNYNVLSPFKQLKNIDNENKRISFNSYMHSRKLATMNEINFDINFYKILQYHLDNNLMYIDGTLLDNEFYQYIIYDYVDENNEHKDVEIVLHKDLIGKDITIPEHYFANYDSFMICAWEDTLYILAESGQHDDTYTLIGTNELYFTEEYNADDEISEFLAFESLDFSYNIESQCYEKEGKKYLIYDKLHSNTETIYSKYISTVNLPNNLKYKNNIHLFNLYYTTTEEHNVLYFHNNIHMYVNGIRFDHDVYTASANKKNEEESMKFYISDKLKNKVDTRYIDIYSLAWNDDAMKNNSLPLYNVPIEICSSLNQYAIFVKRDYASYYEDESNDKNIWELPDIEEYDVNEFCYYFETKQTKAFTLYYKTFEDFYINKQLTDDQLETYEIYENAKVYLGEDNSYYFEDKTVKDLQKLGKKYNNKLDFEIIILDEDNNVINDDVYINLRDIESHNYDKIKVNFYYHKPHIVRNRFYLLGEYVFNNLNLNPVVYEDNGEVYLKTDNNDRIKLIKLKEKYRYYDLVEDHDILNQNPSMYWYSLDNGKITSLPSYLNELERYAYDATKTNINDIKSYLDSYIRKNNTLKTTGKYVDDSNDALFRYINYLEKDLTGWKGTYRLEIETNINEPNQIRLLVEIINEDLSINTYDSTDNATFTLNGNEQKVKLFIQIIDNAHKQYYESDKIYFIPKLIKITDVEEQLRYEYDKCGGGDNPIINIKFLNKEYSYGNNNTEFIYDLYRQFFKLKFNIYDSYITDTNKLNINLLESIYEPNDEIKLHSWLNYDFYLMHDDKYWYGLYISEQTCDKIRNEKDLEIDDLNKRMEFMNNTNEFKYILKYDRTSQEYLINRLEFVSSNGINQFKDDDIICGYIHNNDVLPFSSEIGSKWSVSPMSIGMNTDMNYESNAEMTVISLPKNSTKYQKGYYKVTVRYSLDRDIQHQFKNTSTIKVS